jgi:hypothetical protein
MCFEELLVLKIIDTELLNNWVDRIYTDHG